MSDRLSEVAVLARTLLDAHGLYGWSFGFNRRRSEMGLCLEGRRLIQLSTPFALLNGDDAVRDTLLHEIAHALVGTRHGHGAVWRSKCRELGARPDRVSFEVVMPDGRWQARCESCGTVHHRHRRPKYMRGWWCRFCGRERGKLTWRPACWASPAGT
jgi:predicted SprT family Zn-dependent metalloprotease